MRHSRFLSSGFLILLTAAAFTSALAQPDDAPEGGRGDGQRPPQQEPGRIGIDKPALPAPRLLNVEGLKAMMREIGIADATAEKIVAQTREFNSLLEKEIILVQREELNVRDALLSSNPDMKAIEPIIKRKALIIADIEVAQIKRDVAIRRLLTEEEFDKWKMYMSNAPVRMDGSMRQKPKRRD